MSVGFECRLRAREQTYALNWPIPPKLALEVLFICLVIEPSHNQGLKGVASDIRILMRVD